MFKTTVTVVPWHLTTMAEKLPACARQDLASHHTLEKVVDIADLSDSCSVTSTNELVALRKHQSSIRSSYAIVTASDFTVKVYFPDSRNGSTRPRPRTVFVHGANVGPRALVDRLRQNNITPQQIQVMVNSDIAITFKSTSDTQAFLSLDFVELPGRHLASPVWVRVHFKPAELKLDAVSNHLKKYGSILFSRENRIIGTEVLSGSLTFKMRLFASIPSFIFIGPLCLAVHHVGQIPTCRSLLLLFLCVCFLVLFIFLSLLLAFD